MGSACLSSREAKVFRCLWFYNCTCLGSLLKPCRCNVSSQSSEPLKDMHNKQSLKYVFIPGHMVLSGAFLDLWVSSLLKDGLARTHLSEQLSEGLSEWICSCMIIYFMCLSEISPAFLQSWNVLSEVSSLNSLCPHHQAMSFLVLKKQTGETPALGQVGEAGRGVVHLGLNSVPAMWKLEHAQVLFKEVSSVLSSLLFIAHPLVPHSSKQLQWRLHPGTLSIIVAVWWACSSFVSDRRWHWHLWQLLLKEHQLWFIWHVLYIYIGMLVTEERFGLGIKEQQCILVLHANTCRMNVFFWVDG